MVISPQAQLFVITSAGCFSQYMGDYDKIANVDERICAESSATGTNIKLVASFFLINIKY